MRRVMPLLCTLPRKKAATAIVAEGAWRPRKSPLTMANSGAEE
jgi:hypothetical protein